MDRSGIPSMEATRPKDNAGGEEDHLETYVTKRAASKAPSPTSDAKRLRVSPDGVKETGFQPPNAVVRPRIPFPEKPAVAEERNGEIEYRVVNNDGDRESTIILTGLKCLFQTQLPEMNKSYVARLVYDRAHTSIAIVKMPLQVVGGICYREVRDRKFAEIAFCAISKDEMAKGYGAHLMAHLKDYVRATSSIMHLLTYADNGAIGYFRKQGFSKEISLDKSVWVGLIKDYRGGTLMHCPMVPRVRYLQADRMLLKQKETVQAKIRSQSQSQIVHQPPQQWANGVITPIDPLSIPAIQRTGWSPGMDALAREVPRHGPHFRELRCFLTRIQKHNKAWPFREPVDKNEAPDYYEVVESPMDLSTVEKKLEGDSYVVPKDLVKDLQLMFRNCKQYNGPTTVYVTAAVALEKYMRRLIKENPEWREVLEEE